MVCSLLTCTLASLTVGWAPDFGPPANYAAGYAFTAVSGDFNGDGRPDLAVAGTHLVYVLIGAGDGTFRPAIATAAFPEGSTIHTIVCGDFDGDGSLDLVVNAIGGQNFEERGAKLLRGNADGTFQPPQDFGIYGSLIASVDLNRDGKPDLVTWDGGDVLSGALMSFLNVGGGVFESAWFDFAWGTGTSINFADLNRDGELDLVFTESYYGFGAIVHLGVGGGRFGPRATYYGENAFYIYGLAVADFNGDSAPDLAVSAFPTSDFPLFVGKGDGSFTLGPSIPSGGGYRPAAADFNGDGKPDLISLWSRGVSVLLGDGDNGFAAPRLFDYSQGGNSFVVADFNGDGRSDMAVAIGTGVSVLLNDGNWTGTSSPPVITITNDTATEGDAGTANANFRVRLSFTALAPVSVQYSTSLGPVAPAATPGVDYQETSGVLTFAPGEIEKTISVPVVGDLLTEPLYEYFSVNLSNPSNATIANGVGLCAIYSEETPPEIYISNVSRSEGNSGNTKLTFQVTLSAPIYQTVSVSYRTADGSATTSDRDYSAVNGTLNFAPGERTKTITVQVRGDRKRESDEVFYVDLSSPSANASLGQSRGTGTIFNDD